MHTARMVAMKANAVACGERHWSWLVLVLADGDSVCKELGVHSVCIERFN